ncbi:hypothetical protein SLA2020_186560 [Shorea laevis]
MKFNMTKVLDMAEDSSTRRLALIELEMLLMASAAFFLLVTGFCRRRSNYGLISLFQWLSYTLAIGQIFSLTIGQMQSAQFHNGLFALWGAFIFILFGQNDSFSAYSLEDNEQWKRYSSQVYYQAFLVGLMIGFYIGFANYGWSAFFVTLFLTYKADEKTAALKMASRSSLAEDTKLISDFMACEHLLRTDGEPNPIQMKGYNYLVTGESEEMVKLRRPQYQKQLDVTTDEVITLQKIWQCQGRLLTGEKGQRLKDICLSFALFKLLCRRFGGHPFSESSHEKTWKFVRDGLLSNEGDYNRAFRAIEVELCFLFDLFYTKYAFIFNRGQGFRICRLLNTLAVIGYGGYIAVNSLIKYKPTVHELNLITAGGVDIDKRVTGILMVGILLVEFAQSLFLIASDWATVQLICNYVRGKSWFQNDDNYLMLLRTKTVLLCHDHKWFKPWERKLGQYSLLSSFNRDPRRFKMKGCLSCFLSDLVNVPRQGRKGNKPIELPEEVKKAVILTLKRTNDRRLSNGKKSLQQNEVWDELSWACGLETPTHVILVWHVATSLCMISTRQNSPRNEDFVVATRLSDYCAYLVAFAPRLISGNATDSEYIFDEVIKDARNILKECSSDTDKYQEIMQNRGEEETIIYRGANLATNLRSLQDENNFMWKVLADFWAELMLFLAPSGDPRAHVEHLAKGGEFVTHLWALLSHAGILNNGSTMQDV